jgi:dolichol-phosphate mannosyltransferase
MTQPEISFIVPCFNEEGNLRALSQAIHDAVDPLGVSYEVVITDDCSTDKSWSILQELIKTDSVVRAQRFEHNCGESAASWAGMQFSRGRYLVTIDADLQNDPRDLPKFLDALKHADCVCGTRVESRAAGDNFVRIASSKIANAVRRKLSGDKKITDAGCTYRAFKRECIANVKFWRGAHRFLPQLIEMEGYTIAEVPVTNNPRFAGRSHYGVWNRLFKSFRDLLGVRWLKSRRLRYKVAQTIN